jgi:hypothetical protein
MLRRIRFKSGIDREGTQFTAGPGWYDCDKIRFRKGRIEQIGGWVKYTIESYKGVARSLHDWGTAAAAKYLGIGTNLKFYVESGGGLNDITPLRLTTAAGDITVSATDGDETLTMTETDHGAVMDDYVTFSGLASLGGNITATVLNQEYKIDTVIDTDTFTVEAKDTSGNPVTANASDTGNGGASGVAAYQINVGTNNYVPSVGYGLGVYGAGPYGGGGALLFSGQLRLYSQDTFGDDLIFNPRAGGVYYWDESAGLSARATALSDMGGASDAPVAAFQVMVSPADRHVICFGVNPLGSSAIDPLLVRWSDQENAVDWTPTATNTAGGQVLSSGTTIVGAIKTRQEKLIFTDTSIHAMRFSGAPHVYQFSVVAENVTALSPKAMISVGDAVFFMDLEGFYIYRGAVEPLPCSVFDHVFSSLDRGQVYKVFALNNPDNHEVTWFYPSGASQTEVNKYVTFNYVDNEWTIGNMDRGAWIQAATRTYPIASSNDTVNVETNYLYNQEFGYDAEDQEMLPYIESGRLPLDDGDSLAFLRRFISDFRFLGNSDNASFNIIIKGSDFPLEEASTLSTSTVMADTKQSHVRVRAREIILRIEGTGTGYGWTMGDFRFDLRTDGRR